MRLHRRTAAVLAVLALAGGAAGCGGDEAAEVAATTAADMPASGTMTATVGMEGVSFTPDATSLAAGGTVTWRNTSDISHNVTFNDEDSGTLEVGDEYERTFPKAGTFTYLCTFHAGMKGTVTVG